MSEGKRPGGLTALAVINFIFGGLSALSLLAMAAILAFIGVAANSAQDEGGNPAKELAEAWEQIGFGFFYAILALSAVQTVLLIASGVGYLKQKKFLGRTLGNVYALIAVASSLIMALVVTDPEIGGGFNIGTIVGLVYPVLTLILLNGTFKNDFIR